MVGPAMVVGVVARQAAARAGAGPVTSRLAGQAAKRAARGRLGELATNVAEDLAGQELTRGDLPF